MGSDDGNNDNCKEEKSKIVVDTVQLEHCGEKTINRDCQQNFYNYNDIPSHIKSYIDRCIEERFKKFEKCFVPRSIAKPTIRMGFRGSIFFIKNIGNITANNVSIKMPSKYSSEKSKMELEKKIEEAKRSLLSSGKENSYNSSILYELALIKGTSIEDEKRRLEQEKQERWKFFGLYSYIERTIGEICPDEELTYNIKVKIDKIDVSLDYEYTLDAKTIPVTLTDQIIEQTE